MSWNISILLQDQSLDRMVRLTDPAHRRNTMAVLERGGVMDVDLVAVGGGFAGMVAANRAAALGLTAAESLPTAAKRSSQWVGTRVVHLAGLASGSGVR